MRLEMARQSVELHQMPITETAEGEHTRHAEHLIVWPVEQLLQEHPHVTTHRPLGG